MSQDFTSTFDPENSGAELVAWLIGNFSAILSCHSGTSAPTYAVRGTWWNDTTTLTVSVYKVYDGADWNTVFTLNEATGGITLPAVTVGAATAGGHAMNQTAADARYVQPGTLAAYALLAGGVFSGAVTFNGDISAIGNITLTPGSGQASMNGRWLVTSAGTTDNLRLNRTGAGTPYSWAIFQNAGTTGGSIQWTGSATSYVTSSDGRLKPVRENFDPGEIIDATEAIRHNWLHAPEDWSYGVIAQDAHKIFPQAVTVGSENMDDEDFQPWGVDYSKYVPLLLKEVKSLRARVAMLESANG